MTIKTYVADSISSKYVLRTTFFRVITQFSSTSRWKPEIT